MPSTRPPYAAVFRQQMVELVRSGRTPGELAREFEPSAQAIRNWVAQVDRDAGERSDGLRTEEREELRRLRRENRRLREEREILAKATACSKALPVDSLVRDLTLSRFEPASVLTRVVRRHSSGSRKPSAGFA